MNLRTFGGTRVEDMPPNDIKLSGERSESAAALLEGDYFQRMRPCCVRYQNMSATSMATRARADHATRR